MADPLQVALTGATGFLGRHLVERLLAAGRSVTILGRTPAPDLEKRGVRFIRASLDDATAVAAACTGIDTIFHVAAKVGGGEAGGAGGVAGQRQAGARPR
jgi:nucleoside-diphosphate-sugar epimerase